MLEDIKIELPYIYYLGYEVKLHKNGEIIKLKTYETDNGFVGVTIPILEEGKIEFSYEGTTLMKISSYVSIVSLVVLIIIIIKNKFIKE